MTTNTIPAEKIRIVAGDGLVLKQLGSEDAEAVFSLVDMDREYLKQFDEEIVNEYKSAAAVRMGVTVPENPNKIQIAMWEDGKVIGGINLLVRPGHIAELSFWTSKQFAGQTHGVRGVMLLSEYVFEHMGIKRLVSFVQPGNHAGENVLKEAGFTHLGIVFVERKPRWEYELRGQNSE